MPNASSHLPAAFEVTHSQAFPGTVILGSPTADSVIFSLLCQADTELFVEYGKTPNQYDLRTTVASLKKDQPFKLKLSGLDKDAQYYYRLRHRLSAEIDFSAGIASAFHTQRAPGSAYTFTIQADSHRDNNVSDDIYRQTLSNAAGDKPDFHIDLGDTVMGDKWAKNYQDLAKRYAEERSFFNILCGSAPLFMANGNHEGENGWQYKGQEDSLAVWATNSRKLYYPTPEPGSFYSQSTNEEQFVGLRQSYYAWEWGDALFVILDPFWNTRAANSPSRHTPAAWDWTLGKEQYDWLRTTLQKSPSKFKFVFAHNLVGGYDLGRVGNGRGGAEAACFYEWGGLNTDGTQGFEANRPGWGKPIHQLLVDNKVNIFFHGHDHYFAKQGLDGVVYQECPQPGSRNNNTHADEYAYISGAFIEGTGYVRVNVSADAFKVDFVRTYLPGAQTASRKNGEVGYSYTDTDRVEQAHPPASAPTVAPSSGGQPPPGGRLPASGDPHTSTAPVLPPVSSGTMHLFSPVVKEGEDMPEKYTRQGAKAGLTTVSPPLGWTGAPADTRTFAVIGWNGVIFWSLWNIPGTAAGLAENYQGPSTVGQKFQTPSEGGPGIFTKHLTLYALSASVNVPADSAVETLRQAMQSLTLDSAVLNYKVTV